jgi:para-aminobenzoate synthetase component 1
MLQKNEAIELLNSLGKRQIPFIFYCDFLGAQWCIEPVSKASSFQFCKENRLDEKQGVLANKDQLPSLKKNPVPFEVFCEQFDRVQHQINIGNSFLTNLTFQTQIETSLSLEEIFSTSQAKYKLYVPDEFVVFSPETFVQIYENRIYSFPMKGTIDASIPNAHEILLNDPKEIAEHVTIVDLIRNDLSQVARNVTVPRYRYMDEIQTKEKNLLQVSSEVSGELNADWKKRLGNILAALLPAGSISGAPKEETIRIIKETENYDRGFYTGICGHFDGEKVDSAVMIRFIKKENGQLFYCSGGGITSFSVAEKEYQEMVDKIYLPLN